uniref:Peptidyl-prolyl cis-trans isomerase n=1 Tax=Corethron hystrix TaxID=216773 RepID=A0A7S1B9N7_9STRA|mmetsp:Transcript_18559/g.42433  ORF Transcript_18559/g.42433 Transcript_18559/m.42433 type:complete len:170 (+) Transcript_18559:367-876(+)
MIVQFVNFVIVLQCPKTCENFLQYCTGQPLHATTQRPVGYKDAPFHRILKDFMIQTGDFVNGDGTGSVCIYGTSNFPDEHSGLRLKHDRPGVLSMANSGVDTNGCQFFITCRKAEWLDGKHVVFGRVLDDGSAGGESMLTVRKIENAPTAGDGSGRPRVPVVITECGEL